MKTTTHPRNPSAEPDDWPGAGTRGYGITRDEHLHWKAIGAALAEPVIEQFGSYTQEQLKRFVLDYCDGRIYCDHQVPNQRDVGMVFMPILFGAFSTVEPSPAWQQEQKLPKHPGDKPTKPDPPDEVEKPTYPDPPTDPVFAVEDEEVVRKLAFEHDDDGIEINAIADLFATVEGEESPRVREYRESVAANNEQARRDHEAALDEWRAATKKLDADYATAMGVRQQEVIEWEAEVKGLQGAVDQWKRDKAIHDAASQGFIFTRMQNLGVIYEDIGKAGPRSINGQPIFYSLRIINTSDWNRARKAITRELERRENMEI